MDFNINYSIINCCRCGFIFATPTVWDRERREDHKSFYCPACGVAQSYRGITEAQKLKKELEEKNSWCSMMQEERDYFAKRASGYKGYAAKLKKKMEKEESDGCQTRTRI